MFLKDFGKTALIFREKEFSYKEVIENVKSFSALFSIAKGEKIAIYSENRPEWIYALYSVWNNKGIAVIVDFMSSPEEVSYILNDCKPKYIFASSDNEEKLNKALENVEYKPEKIVFDNMPQLSHKDVEYIDKPDDINDTAVILYTSGTTGNPKGVMLSYDNLDSNIDAIVTKEKIFRIEDKVLAVLPFHHIFPLQGTILMPLFIGGTTVIVDKISSEEILKALNNYKVSIIIGVPRLYKLFHSGLKNKINASFVAKLFLGLAKAIKSLKLSRILFKKVQNAFGGNLKYLVSGGAKLEEDVGKDMYAMGFEIIEGYGMSEASPLISFTKPGKVKIGSAGNPMVNNEVKIVDGEVLVSGRNIMKGYYGKPEETDKIVIDGWLHTGDLGRLDNKNRLYLTGRKKEMLVLSNGKNINPEEIESKILEISSDLIKETGVFLKDNKLFALVLPNFDKFNKESLVNIFETIKWQVLDKYNKTTRDFKKVFNFKIISRELPKTRLGKLRRFIFKDLLSDEKKEVKQTEEPVFEEYKILKEYLFKATNKTILPEDHIELDLGLDSLDKIELQSYLETSFGITIGLEDLSKNFTVATLAQYVNEKKTKIESEDINWDKILNENVEIKISDDGFFLKLSKFIFKPIAKLYFRLSFTNNKIFPDRPFIISPNHQSFLDGFLLAFGLPGKILKNTYFLANSKHFKSKFSNFIAKHSNVLTVDINRNLKNSLQKVAYLIKKGKNIVIFPEGARTRDGSLMPFKKTFAILSKVLNAPVVPTAIVGALQSFPVGARIPKPVKIGVTFLEPINPGNKDFDEITFLTRNSIEKHLSSL
ncbi:MAG TPA: AMP-binding protein [Spirochaetota bacterium]|nr:AMP-binding protein [Spirochaetota bacterium]